MSAQPHSPLAFLPSGRGGEDLDGDLFLGEAGIKRLVKAGIVADDNYLLKDRAKVPRKDEPHRGEPHRRRAPRQALPSFRRCVIPPAAGEELHEDAANASDGRPTALHARWLSMDDSGSPEKSKSHFAEFTMSLLTGVTGGITGPFGASRRTREFPSPISNKAVYLHEMIMLCTPEPKDSLGSLDAEDGTPPTTPSPTIGSGVPDENRSCTHLSSLRRSESLSDDSDSSPSSGSLWSALTHSSTTSHLLGRIFSEEQGLHDNPVFSSDENLGYLTSRDRDQDLSTFLLHRVNYAVDLIAADRPVPKSLQTHVDAIKREVETNEFNIVGDNDFMDPFQEGAMKSLVLALEAIIRLKDDRDPDHPRPLGKSLLKPLKFDDIGITSVTRASVTGWMWRVAQSMSWSPNVCLLGIHAMDAYCLAISKEPDTKSPPSLPLLSTATLFLGVGLDEDHTQSRRIRHFIGKVPTVKSVKQIRASQMEILAKLPHGLISVTPYDLFFEYLHRLAQVESILKRELVLWTVDQVKWQESRNNHSEGLFGSKFRGEAPERLSRRNTATSINQFSASDDGGSDDDGAMGWDEALDHHPSDLSPIGTMGERSRSYADEEDDQRTKRNRAYLLVSSLLTSSTILNQWAEASDLLANFYDNLLEISGTMLFPHLPKRYFAMRTPVNPPLGIPSEADTEGREEGVVSGLELLFDALLAGLLATYDGGIYAYIPSRRLAAALFISLLRVFDDIIDERITGKRTGGEEGGRRKILNSGLYSLVSRLICRCSYANVLQPICQDLGQYFARHWMRILLTPLVDHIMKEDARFQGISRTRVKEMLDGSAEVPWSPNCPVDPIVSEVIHRLGKLDWLEPPPAPRPASPFAQAMDRARKPPTPPVLVQVPAPSPATEAGANGGFHRPPPRYFPTPQVDPNGIPRTLPLHNLHATPSMNPNMVSMGSGPQWLGSHVAVPADRPVQDPYGRYYHEAPPGYVNQPFDQIRMMNPDNVANPGLLPMGQPFAANQNNIAQLQRLVSHPPDMTHLHHAASFGSGVSNSGIHGSGSFTGSGLHGSGNFGFRPENRSIYLSLDPSQAVMYQAQAPRQPFGPPMGTQYSGLVELREAVAVQNPNYPDNDHVVGHLNRSGDLFREIHPSSYQPNTMPHPMPRAMPPPQPPWSMYK